MKLYLPSGHTLTSWAFGFFTPLAMAAVAALAIFLIAAWWKAPDYFGLAIDAAWSGGWLFVALAIIFGIVLANII